MRALRLIEAFWDWLGRVAARRRLTVLLVGVGTFLACVGIDALRPHDSKPVPEIHDEYAYLLAADTFASGRLTNPPHPLWRSFETMHVLQRPTYQSKFPPAQGLFLALGQVIFGRPLAGVWISAALFLSALCWMLQGYVPARWALVGTILGASTMVLGGKPLAWSHVAYWSQSFWGGAVGALGGALVLGALPRIVRRADWVSALILGLGTCVMALSRPYEGVLLTMCVGAVLAGWFFGSHRHSMGVKLTRVVAPAGLVCALGLAWLALFNLRVTGSPWRLPYMEYRDQYQMMPTWVWEPVRPEHPGLNRQMSEFVHWEVGAGNGQAPLPWRLSAMFGIVGFEAGPIVAGLMILMLPWTVRGRWLMFAGIASVVVLAGLWLSTYLEVHYHAPAAALTILLAVASLRRLSLVRRGPRGLWLGVSLALVLATLGRAVYQWYDSSRQEILPLEAWSRWRQEIADKLVEMGGKHVVFVRYPPVHGVHIELVYNRADIDGSPVVFARDLGAEQNDKVFAYYPDRACWLFTIDNDNIPGRMAPFRRAPGPGQQPSPAPTGR